MHFDSYVAGQKDYVSAKAACESHELDLQLLNIGKNPKEKAEVIRNWRLQAGFSIEFGFYAAFTSTYGTKMGNDCPSFIIKSNGFQPPTGTRPCSMPLHYICEQKHSQQDCSKPGGDFAQIRPGSKYLYLQGDDCSTKDHNVILKRCQDLGLEVISFTSLFDHRSFQKYAANKPEGRTYSMGIRINENLDWVENDNTNIQFSWFADGYPSEPVYRPCTCLTPDWDLSQNVAMQFHWRNQNCSVDKDSTRMCTICQFPKSSDCYEISNEERNKPKIDTLKRIGESDDRFIYIGTLQKNRAEAMESCEKNGYQFLNVDRNPSLLANIIENWRRDMGLSIDLSFYAESVQLDNAAGCFSYTVDKQNRNKITHSISIKPCSLPHFYLCQEENTDYDCTQRTPNFIPFHKNSKFFYLAGDTCQETSHKAVTDKCREGGFVPFTVSSIPDLQSIQKHVRLNLHNLLKDIAYCAWPMDLFVAEDGSWNWETGDGQIIEFQSFVHWAPHNNVAATCGYIEWWPYETVNHGYVFMRTQKCKMETWNMCTVCMYPPSSSCFKNSEEESRKPKDGLTLIGKTRKAKIYAGNLQKSFDETKEYCAENGMRLMNINENNSTAFIQMLMMWRDKKRSVARDIGFWAESNQKNKCTFFFLEIDREKNIIQIEAQNMDRVKRPCSMPHYFFCSAPKGREDCRGVDDLFPIRPHSKYLHIPGDMCEEKSTAEVTSVCTSLGLEPMTIKTLEEHRSFEEHITRVSPKGKESPEWYLSIRRQGFSDVYNSVQWEYDNHENIKFQMFDTKSPRDKEEYSAVSVKWSSKWHTDRRFLYWTNQLPDRSDNGFCIACMYADDDICSEESYEVLASNTVDELYYIGGTDTTSIYTGSLQKTYIEAEKSCMDQGLRFLNYDRHSSTFGNIVNDWRIRQGFSPDYQFYARSRILAANHPCPAFSLDITTTKFVLVEPLRKPCSLRRNYFCEKMKFDHRCGQGAGIYKSVSPTSKYLYEIESKSNYEDMYNSCWVAGLELLSFDNYIEYQMFEKFALANFFTHFSEQIYLDMKYSQGHWKTSHNKSIKTSMFTPWAPINTTRNPCGTMEMYGYKVDDDTYIYWTNKPCNTTEIITRNVCQYPEYSRCFKESSEEKGKEFLKDEVINLHANIPGKGEIYVGTMQKTHNEAVKMCEYRGFKLLDINLFKIETFFEPFSLWRKALNLNPEIGFWARNATKKCFSTSISYSGTTKYVKGEGKRICSLPLYYFCQKEEKPKRFKRLRFG